MQVEMFSCSNELEVENNVNHWQDTNMNKEIIDIKMTVKEDMIIVMIMHEERNFMEGL